MFFSFSFFLLRYNGNTRSFIVGSKTQDFYQSRVLADVVG